MGINESTFMAILADVLAGSAIRRALADNAVNPRDFYAALDVDEELAKRYARAINAGWDAFADDTVRVADDDKIPADQKRIMVDTRKWLLAKRLPKRYGERTVIAGDADNPLVIEDHKAAVLRGLTPPATAERAGSADSGAVGATGEGTPL